MLLVLRAARDALLLQTACRDAYLHLPIFSHGMVARPCSGQTCSARSFGEPAVLLRSRCTFGACGLDEAED